MDWLDRLTFREIEMINESEKRNSDYLYLNIEFPTVQVEGTSVKMNNFTDNYTLFFSKNLIYNLYNRQHAVVYYEQDGDEMYQFRAQADIVTVPDCEILQVSYLDLSIIR